MHQIQLANYQATHFRYATEGKVATITLDRPLAKAHAAGEYAGTEFVQYRWYPDVALDNIFFHDHVNGIHGWSHGMVGQLIIEPKGSRYFDPISGAEIRAGAAGTAAVDRDAATDQGFRISDTCTCAEAQRRCKCHVSRFTPRAPSAREIFCKNPLGCYLAAW